MGTLQPRPFGDAASGPPGLPPAQPQPRPSLESRTWRGEEQCAATRRPHLLPVQADLESIRASHPAGLGRRGSRSRVEVAMLHEEAARCRASAKPGGEFSGAGGAPSLASPRAAWGAGRTPAAPYRPPQWSTSGSATPRCLCLRGRLRVSQPRRSTRPRPRPQRPHRSPRAG